jgi:hypothetical protein
MKKKPASQSAFFNPRVLIGFALCSIGVSLALVGWSKSVTDSLGADGSQVPMHSTTKLVSDQLQLSTNWPQYGFDPQHTSFNPEETLSARAPCRCSR